ncbi:MAG: tyrosine-type recombinase/integrase [Bryobacteraceae bacterium]
MIYKRRNHWHMDAMVNGVRYREALHTTDRREATMLEKKRVSEIHQGKGASLSGREFARLPFGVAADQFIENRRPHVSERTSQLERNLCRPLRRFFGEKPPLRIRATDISGYQRTRRETGISGRTLNMEIGVLRQILKMAKVWSIVAEDVKRDPESITPVARVLTAEQKQHLFNTAGSKPEWMVAHCAAALAASTTCRGIELKHLHWHDLDLFVRTMTIRRSKTKAGHRSIPLNGDALAAIARLWERSHLLGSDEPHHFVFPACERRSINPDKPQRTWRTAWRSLTRAAGLKGLRFHDLRHQAITELAETGASDATLMAVAGHMSREMLEHYSHVRMAAKRTALDKLESGLMGIPSEDVRSTQLGSVN